MISTKGRYALRVMIDMAEQKTNDFIPLNEIADRQGISIKYLEIILKSLVRANLLEGRRGKGGGYKLTRPPQEYTVGEILELTENSLASVACLMKNAKPCERKATCRTFRMWEEFTKVVSDFFYGRTLADLMQEEAKPVVCQIAPPKSKTNNKGKK